MRFLLLTTTDMAANRGADVDRMLASVAGQKGIDVSLRLLAQNCDAEALRDLESRLPAFAEADAVAFRVPLSAARNRLLGGLRGGDGRDTIVAFPDDDCWYPNRFLDGVAEFFTARPSADLFVCGFGPSPVGWNDVGLNIRRGSAARVVRTASSITTFVRATALPQSKAFDERLGLGAPFNGGEDTDFAIRAFLSGRDAYVTSTPLVGHPEKSRESAGRYYRGTALAIAKHARQSPALFVEFVRKILVGLVLFCRGEIRSRDLAPSMREVWRSRR